MSLLNKKAPAFTLPNQDDEKVSLKDYKDKWLVVYFYPKDSTPGCTVEANDFTAAVAKFKKMNCEIIGVSADSVKSHQNFCTKQKLKIQLLSDPDKKMIEKYGVWQLKKNYGKEYMGIVRSTFLISPAGKVVAEWEKVKVKGHVDEVMNTLKEKSTL